jgi:hypothetical protein
MWLPGSHKVNAFMGNIANETESMTSVPYPGWQILLACTNECEQPRGPLSECQLQAQNERSSVRFSGCRKAAAGRRVKVNPR